MKIGSNLTVLYRIEERGYDWTGQNRGRKDSSWQDRTLPRKIGQNGTGQTG